MKLHQVYTYDMNRYLIITAAVIFSVSACSNSTPAVKPAPVPGKTAPEPFSQIMIEEHQTPAGPDFSDYLSSASNGPVIPGLYQGAIPQGLAYSKSLDLLFISNYMFNGTPSSISIVSMKDGTFLKVLRLINPDGTPHKGHVGGLAVSARHLWIASGKGVYRARLQDTLNIPNEGKLKMEEFIRTAVKGSFASFADNTLWIGEFTSRDGSYSAAKSHTVKTGSGVNHGWMAGYNLDPDTDLIKSNAMKGGSLYPDKIISIPDEVQGAAFYKEFLILSTSYGRTNKSRLVSYRLPSPDRNINQAAGISIPITVLTSAEKIKTVVVPPMSEGLAVYNDSIAVLYESGSDKYRSTALLPQGRIQMLDPSIFMK